MNNNTFRGLIMWLILVVILVSIFAVTQVAAILAQRSAINKPYNPDAIIVNDPLFEPKQ